MLQLYDTIVMDDGAKVRFTGDGYLVAQPRVARTGIQLYSGAEVGKPEMKVVRVFRPEAEVFDKDSMHSYAHKPFTNDHPPEPVTADNWKKYSAGDMGEDVARDGEFIRVPVVMMDAQAISDYRDGKRELSLGYTCDLQWTPGTAPNGEAYDAVQTTIRANHLALVKRARGGSGLRVGDDNQQQENDAMTTATQTAIVMVDGAALNVDAVSASVINAHLGRMSKTIESLQGKLDETEKDKKKSETDAATVATQHKTTLDAKDAEIATLKKQVEDGKLSPDAIDKLVIDRAAVIAAGKKALGDKLVITGKTDAMIRRQVVDAKMGETSKGWSDDAVAASFNTIVASLGDTSNTNNGGGGGGNHRPGGIQNGMDELRQAFRFDSNPQNLSDGDKAYGEMTKHLSEAYRNPNGVAA
jgi:uncharacterized protein